MAERGDDVGAHKRIVIFGNGASGKSTLARRLATELGVDCLELDHVRWEERPHKPNSPERCREIIEAFIGARDAWIVEGLHASLLEHALRHASELHFLNPGFDVCRARALARPWDPAKSPSPEAQAAAFTQFEPFFRSYDTRSDETSLAAHRRLFDAFDGAKHEHTGERVEVPDLTSDSERG